MNIKESCLNLVQSLLQMNTERCKVYRLWMKVSTTASTIIHLSLPLKNDCSYSPSMFISSPLTAQPDDSLIQASMSSFIKNDDSISVIKNEDSMLTVERELFDSTTKKKVVEDVYLLRPSVPFCLATRLTVT